jgi:hypothetical protein
MALSNTYCMMHDNCTVTTSHCPSFTLVCLQKQLASERIAALLEDRHIREGEEAAHRAHMNQQVQDLSAKLKASEEQLRQTTKDYILGAHASGLLPGCAVIWHGSFGACTIGPVSVQTLS